VEKNYPEKKYVTSCPSGLPVEKIGEPMLCHTEPREEVR
jgi:hypothetical protein